MSASDVEQCIKRYLREHDGAAPAGEVTAYATAAGHAPSTVRRVAGRIVTKTRTGNEFVWSLKPAPVFVASPEPVDVPSRPGRLVDKRKKPSLWDAMHHNGQSMRPDPSLLSAPPSEPVESRRDRLADDEADPGAEPAWVSEYERMSQSERMHLIAQRPTLAGSGYTDGLPELSDAEAVAILELDDAGEFTLPTAPGAGLPYQSLPY